MISHYLVICGSEGQPERHSNKQHNFLHNKHTTHFSQRDIQKSNTKFFLHKNLQHISYLTLRKQQKSDITTMQHISCKKYNKNIFFLHKDTTHFFKKINKQHNLIPETKTIHSSHRIKPKYDYGEEEEERQRGGCQTKSLFAMFITLHYNICLLCMLHCTVSDCCM